MEEVALVSGQSDAIFAKFVLKARMVTDEDLNACVGYQSRLRSEGKHISLGQALIKKRLLKASQFLQIRKRLETQTFLCGSCQAPFSWRDVEGRSDARCSSCNNLLSAGGFDGSAKEVTSEGRPRVTLPAKKEKSKGARFGQYEILELIGQGGMGLVYKARQLDLNRIVAIKMLKEGEGASPEQVERFKREAQSAAKLQHPNIIGIHEVGVESGYHYFTMDYVEGDTLQDCFNRGEVFQEDKLLRLSDPIARALHYAHTKGVVHRDVKPANIILDSEGNPKITDFGLAKIETDSNLTKSGVAIGTPLYMSPEQARGDLKAIDNRSDLFSLGIIMYQMSTGRLPFIGDSHIEIYNQIIYEESTPPRRLNTKLSRDAEIIILKALEKLPRNRYQNCGELAEDIARIRVGEAIRAKPLGLVEKFMRTTLRHRSFLGGVVIGLVLLVVVLILFASWSDGPGPETDLGKQRRELLAVVKADHGRGNWKAVISGADGFHRSEYAYSEEAVQAFMLAAEAVQKLELRGETALQEDAEVLLGRALSWAHGPQRDEVYLRLGALFLAQHDADRLAMILARVQDRRPPEYLSLAVRHKLLSGDVETALRQLGAPGGSRLAWLAEELRKWIPSLILKGEKELRCSAAADNVLYLCRGNEVRVLEGNQEQLLPLAFGPGIDAPDLGLIRNFAVFPSGERAYFALQRESGRLQLGTVETNGLEVEFQSARMALGVLTCGDLFGDSVPEVYVSGGSEGKLVYVFEKAGNLWRDRELIEGESAIRGLLVQDESLFLSTEGPLSWLRALKRQGAGAEDLTEVARTEVGNVTLLARGQEGALFGRSETPSLLYLATGQRPNGVYSVKLQGIDVEAAPVLLLGRGASIDDVQQHLGVSFCLYTVYASGQELSVLRVEGHGDGFEIIQSEVRGRQLHLLDLDGDADAELVITGPEGIVVMGRAP